MTRPLREPPRVASLPLALVPKRASARPSSGDVAFEMHRNPVMRPKHVTWGAVAALLSAVIVAGASIGNAAASTCDPTDVEYAVAANLRVTGTLMGAGDGEYRIGPGRIVLRFDRDPSLISPSPSSVRMMAYDMSEKFQLVSKIVFFTTSVLTDIRSHATPDVRSVVAEGVLTGRTLRWTKVAGSFRSDGTLTCEGFFCGKFGAAPAGTSPFHMGPSKMPFSSFEFSSDMKTFSMPSTLNSKTADPQQESYVALAGREMRRDCVNRDAEGQTAADARQLPGPP